MKVTTRLRSLIFAALLTGLAVAHANVSPNAVWIDVRTPAEYNQGHLEQARHVPFDRIEVGVAGLQLAEDTPIYLYCAVGGRAELAKKRLEAMGYRNVTNVGGLKQALQLAGESRP